MVMMIRKRVNRAKMTMVMISPDEGGGIKGVLGGKYYLHSDYLMIPCSGFPCSLHNLFEGIAKKMMTMTMKRTLLAEGTRKCWVE